MKINTIMPLPLRKQIQNTIKYMESLPRNESKVNNFVKLTEAWLLQRRVKINYVDSQENEPVESIIDPYYIEPSAQGHSNYLIAFCHRTKVVKTFKINRILGDVSICPDSYEIPSNFNVVDYLGSAWGIHTDKDLYTVKLRFTEKLGRSVKETFWHPSQRVELQSDGSVILIFRVRDTLDFRAWILGWGGNVEVLEPKILREGITNAARAIIRANTDMEVSRKSVFNAFPIQTYAANAIFSELTDKQWDLVSGQLPPQAKVGRPRIDDRRIVNGILWVFTTGSRWADIPRKYGAHSTCHFRFKSWQKQGVWRNIWLTLFPQPVEPLKSSDR
jgi:hypothetical protein